MLADMYNLAPSIGVVNAMRSNYNFTEGLNSGHSIGQCSMKIDTSRRKAEPRLSGWHHHINKLPRRP